MHNQLQYLVQWKGFSKVHDSWEPLTHICTNNLIQKFHQENPASVHSTHKRNPPQTPIIICTLQIMSTPSSPAHSSLVNSPAPISPPLLEHITDPPCHLTIQEHLGITPDDINDSGYEVPHPSLECELYEIRGSPNPDATNIPLPSTSPAPMGLQVPPRYAKYDPLDANHSRYVKGITLKAYKPPLSPHYIKFHHNFTTNQHYVYGLHDDANPPTSPYGWSLEATPFISPVLSPYTVNNKALGIYDSHSLLAREVDVALYALNDYGVTADMNHY
jgi:hypothetical protein